jgi:hypothetical protein
VGLSRALPSRNGYTPPVSSDEWPWRWIRDIKMIDWGKEGEGGEAIYWRS